jgi:hypothetical protein
MPHRPDRNVVTGEAEKARCVGVRNTDTEIDSNANSEDFAFPGGGGVVTSSAKSYLSQSDVDGYVAMVHSPKFSGCYEQMMRKSGGPGDTLEQLSVNITSGSDGGPTNVVATGASTVKVNGQPMAISLAFISGPLMTAEVIATGMNGTPIPTSQMDELVTAVATRAAKG